MAEDGRRRRAEALWSSAPGCIALTVVGIALSLAFLWRTGDGLDVTAEKAGQAHFTLTSARLETVGRRRDRFEWEMLAADGAAYTLRSEACGGRFDEIVASVRVGDMLNARLDRDGGSLELDRDGVILLPFEAAAKGRARDAFGFGVLAAVMLVCAAAALVRSVRLVCRRRIVRRATSIP